MMEEYSPYKIVHHQDKLQQMREGKQLVPLQVQIVPTNKCLHNCSFCSYRMEGYPSNKTFTANDELKYEDIVNCLDDFVDMGIKAVHYTGGGEPLMHPHILSILRDTLERGLDLALVTNGELISEIESKTLADSLWVRVSIDSINPDTFSKIRRIDKRRLRKVLEGVELLVKHRQQNTIGIGFVISKENYKEVVEAAQRYKQMGVNNFRISASFQVQGIEYFKDFREEAHSLCKEAESLSDESFQVFNLFDDRIEDLFHGSQNYVFCPFKELSTYIGADSNVYTCCTLAYNNRGLIGSIKEKSFKELWDGEAKRDLFKRHSPLVDCQNPCLYESKNNFINYCLNESSKHINYV